MTVVPRRLGPAIVAGILAALVVFASPAAEGSAVHEVTAGSFFYRDEATGSEDAIRIHAGDRVRVTVIDSGRGTPHTVEIDEFGVSSGRLQQGQTYTTPPLDRPGTYRFYCDPHDSRGHVTTLVIEGEAPPPEPTPDPEPTPTPEPTSEPTSGPTTSEPTPTSSSTSAAPSTSPSATETPPDASSSPPSEPSAADTDETTAPGDPDDVDEPGAAAATDGTEASPGTAAEDGEIIEGVGVADPDALAELLGDDRPRSNWTRAWWLSLLGALPLVAAAVWALRSGPGD